MTHLTSDELIDAMEGLLAPERHAHLATCEACREQLTALAEVLGEARQVSVPEPSPLFWQLFSARVRSAIDAAPGSGSSSWLRWRVLAPLGALALVVLALAANIRPASKVSDYLTEDAALDAPLDADGWATLTVLVGELDLETASAAGVIEPGVAEQAVLELTSEEQQELARLLNAELMRAKS